jgi:hypothetical protein
VPHNDIEEEIHACLYTCYYFDKTLSVLLLRPPSLPDLKVDPTQLIHLDPDLPTTPIIRGIVEFAHIKSTLVNILLDSKKMGDMDKANVLSNLVARAHAVHSDLEIVRSDKHASIVMNRNSQGKLTRPSIGAARNKDFLHPGELFSVNGCQWISTTTLF